MGSSRRNVRNNKVNNMNNASNNDKGEKSPNYNNNDSDPNPEIELEKKRTVFQCLYVYLCCCIPRNTVARRICLVITAFMFIGLGIVGYFYWPRFPTIKVVSLQLNDLSGAAFKFEIPPEAGGNLNLMTITLSLKMNVSCFNHNIYDLRVETMDLKAYMACNMTQILSSPGPASLNLQSLIGPAPVGGDPNYKPDTRPLIGTAKRDTLIFPAKTNSTFEMTFQLKYTPDPVVGLIKDPAFAELLNVCGITSRRRPVRIEYYAFSQVAILKSLGYVPVVEGHLNVDCPAQKEQIEELLNLGRGSDGQIADGRSPLEVLQGVFTGSG
jgi:hypothetical protein